MARGDVGDVVIDHDAVVSSDAVRRDWRVASEAPGICTTMGVRQVEFESQSGERWDVC